MIPDARPRPGARQDGAGGGAGSLNCLFELYSHEAVAKDKGLSPLQIATLAAGGHPNDLDEDEELACVIASALLRGAPLANTTYAAGVDR